MPSLISFEQKDVPPLGLNPNRRPNRSKIKEFFFDEDFQTLSLLQNFPKQTTALNPTLFYPGSSADILTPLLYIENLFPEVNDITFIFMDLHNMLDLIKTTLHECNISFAQQENKLQFYWNGLLVTLLFHVQDAFSTQLPPHDIYFEKLFRIYKEDHFGFENKVLSVLNSDGFIISDTSFTTTQSLAVIPIAKELSSYQDMFFAKKKKESQ